MHKYKLVSLGGTFDRLHKGHKYFIQKALGYGEKVVIGLMSDKYVKEKFGAQKREYRVNCQIQNYQIRKDELERFLKRKNLWERAQIKEIDDVYGDIHKNTEIEAIIVTRTSYKGAQEINRRRRQFLLKPLKIIKVPLILSSDKRSISSSRVRLGEIDRDGNLYRKVSYIRGKISPSMRKKLKRPLGQLFKNREGDTEDIYKLIKLKIFRLQRRMIITVGDIVTKDCIAHGISPSIAIFDYKVQRKKIFSKDEDLGIPHFDSTIMRKVYVGNSAGRVTKSLSEKIYKAILAYLSIGKFYIIKIEGEDDLAAIPAILLSPLCTIVLYGQPAYVEKGMKLRRGRPKEGGVVMVEVTERIKRKVVEMIKRN